MKTMMKTIKLMLLACTLVCAGAQATNSNLGKRARIEELTNSKPTKNQRTQESTEIEIEEAGPVIEQDTTENQFIEKLCNDELQLIFSYLFSPTTFQNINEKMGFKAYSLVSMDWYLNAPKSITNLDLSTLKPEQMLVILSTLSTQSNTIARFPYLTTLNLSGTSISNENLALILESYPNLQHLGLRCRQITDTGLIEIAKHCPNLQHLDLRWCRQITDTGLSAIAQNCPNLQHLDIACCRQITDTGLKAIAQNCPNLQHLVLWGCHLTCPPHLMH